MTESRHLPRADPFLAAARDLGFSREEVARGETVDSILAKRTVLVRDCRSLPGATQDALVGAYDANWSLDVTRYDPIEERDVIVQVTPSSIGDSLSTQGIADEDEVTLRFRLRKPDCLPRDAARDAVLVRWFLLEESVHLAAQRGLRHFESSIWPEDDRRICLAVSSPLETPGESSADVLRIGPFLGVGSGDFADQAASLAEAKHRDWSAVHRFREDIRQRIPWSKDWVRSLTPLHFEFQHVEGSSKLTQLLDWQLFKLFVLHCCDRARAVAEDGETVIVADFRGNRFRASIRVGDGSVGCPVSEATRFDLVATMQWCFLRHVSDDTSPWISEKLAFLQTRIAQALEPTPEQERAATLVKEFPNVVEVLRWQWKSFFEGRIEAYLGTERELEDLVGETVAQVRSKVADLTKRLSDSVLQSVATVVGVFVVAAFKKPFDADLFSFGLKAYALYLAVFPGLVGGLSLYGDLRALWDGFAGRRDRIADLQIVRAGVSQKASDRAQKARRRFVTWLVVSSAIFTLMALGAWWAADALPELLSPSKLRTLPSSAPHPAVPYGY